ncbi:MAG TPA: carboxylate-amine ligase [Chloroflexota bacterium]|nr:carboxylate-amine ligase [Chloroflexota bacterium]
MFSIGVEEEFQIVDPETGALKAHINEMLPRGRELLGDQIKPEMLQSMVELITTVCKDVREVRQQVTHLRTTVSDLARERDLRIVAAGTHPFSHWQTQSTTDHERYHVLEEDLQDVVRSILIFGLHVHIGMPDRQTLIEVMNEVRYFLPHILALSTSSPFWLGRETGLKSYRTIVWSQFPRTGIPDPFASWQEYESYVDLLIHTGCIDNGKKIWWDLRPHPLYNTLEFRVCDMPVTADETIAIAALFQAVVARLYQLRSRNLGFRTYPSNLILENKWRAARYGLDGMLIDFGKREEAPARDLMEELLSFVDPVLDELGSRDELETVRRIMRVGTGADRQLAAFRRHGNAKAVVDHLIEETIQGLPVASAQPDQVPV